MATKLISSCSFFANYKKKSPVSCSRPGIHKKNCPTHHLNAEDCAKLFKQVFWLSSTVGLPSLGGQWLLSTVGLLRFLQSQDYSGGSAPELHGIPLA